MYIHKNVDIFQKMHSANKICRSDYGQFKYKIIRSEQNINQCNIWISDSKNAVHIVIK